jgi:hypothetical protein
MSLMKSEPRPKLGRLLQAAATAMVLTAAGCSTTIRILNPGNLRVEVRSFSTTYSQSDSFTGLFMFTNRSLLNSIHAEFGSSQLYDLVFYDSLGIEQFHYNQGAEQVITYLELAPMGTRTEQLRFRFYSLPPGPYRVHAWVMGHEDIYSETTIEVR